MIYSSRQFTLTDNTFVAEASDLGMDRIPTEIQLGHLGQVLRFVWQSNDTRDGDIMGYRYKEHAVARHPSMAHEPRLLLIIND
jgi:hypothetical protein